MFDRENVVDEETGKELADKNGIGFFQTSAQSKIGIKELFVYAVDLYIEKFGCKANPTINEDIDTEKRKKKNRNKDDCCGGKKNKNQNVKEVTDDDGDDIANDLNVK